MKAWRWSVPLAIFLVLLAFLWMGLGRDPSVVPSPLIGKPAPSFRLAQLHKPNEWLQAGDLKGKVWLLNVWASWCVSCREEHPLLLQLAKSDVLPVYGLDYKDKQDQALAWLAQNGDPYTASIVDADGRVGIDYGVYGVPETFLIDKQGIIRYKQIGPLTVQSLKDKILPLAKELQK
ncbi:MAG TPA: DsbE family thiol:disulfide interchange protein [Casimicrobiaceae bacterium]|nr:DsbE family thiol:disulfide interchange protein [Casimicrobiaceae bacterium]